MKKSLENIASFTKKMLKNVSIAATLALPMSGCGTYSSETVSFPNTKETSTVERCIPVDKVYYIPWAMGKGFYATGLHVSNQDAPLGFVTAVPEGIFNTVIDTTLNAVSFLPIEVYEAVTGRAWHAPWMPMSTSMLYKDYEDAVMNAAMHPSSPEE